MGRIIVIFMCAFSLTAIAQELSPEAYVKADLEARSITLAGMEARLTMMQQSVNTVVQYRQADENRQNVEAVFASYGFTGASHAAYGTRNGEAIAAWLEGNPDLQKQYNDLAVRFDALSSQFDSLSNGR
ncbi:secreted protein [Candidatus Thiomargarita nelsonii]|uniref:Secreted protein n=1 Tax=Candidatus Thiomargarita nelsonii TaxID=1003181 RepID=A0A176S771_9GAMM|nr:secreted protein [Candidatus Thiomargarita nelsonii]